MREDGIHFRRQHAIGNYIVHFSPERDDVRAAHTCPGRRCRGKLIIELDGSQHWAQQEYDAGRTKYLELQGYQVLRFWNHDGMNHMDEVLNVIRSARSTPALLLVSLPPGGY